MQRKKICRIAVSSVSAFACAVIIFSATIPVMKIKTKSVPAENETDKSTVTYTFNGVSLPSLTTNIYIGIDGIKYEVTDPPEVDIIMKEIRKLDTTADCAGTLVKDSCKENLRDAAEESDVVTFKEEQEIYSGETDSDEQIKSGIACVIYVYGKKYVLIGNTLTSSDGGSVILSDKQAEAILNIAEKKKR